MQKTKKRIIGIGGLAAVAAMTAYAVTVPVPDAAAAVNGQVKISVSVYGEETWTKITSIKDGEVFNGSTITIGNTYTSSNRVDYTLYKEMPDGSKVYANLGTDASFVPSTIPGAGENSFEFDLNSSSALGYGKYVLKVVAEGPNGTYEDEVSFNFSPIEVTVVGTDNDGNIIVDINHGSDTKTADVQVYDKSGRPILSRPMQVTFSGSDGGTMRVTIPVGGEKLASGDYTITATGRKANGDITNTGEANINYVSPEDGGTPSEENTPDVPKTGDILKSLNISRSDFLITGMIMFGLATFFAIRTIKKRSKK